MAAEKAEQSRLHAEQGKKEAEAALKKAEKEKIDAALKKAEEIMQMVVIENSKLVVYEWRSKKGKLEKDKINLRTRGKEFFNNKKIEYKKAFKHLKDAYNLSPQNENYKIDDIKTKIEEALKVVNMLIDKEKSGDKKYENVSEFMKSESWIILK